MQSLKVVAEEQATPRRLFEAQFRSHVSSEKQGILGKRGTTENCTAGSPSASVLGEFERVDADGAGLSGRGTRGIRSSRQCSR